MVNLKDRVAIVTGGGQGIGAATAQRLAAAGAAVAVVDLVEDNATSVVTKITEDGGTAVGIACDVSQEDQVAARRRPGRVGLGPVGVLVNNAGVLRDNLLFKMSRRRLVDRHRHPPEGDVPVHAGRAGVDGGAAMGAHREPLERRCVG